MRWPWQRRSAGDLLAIAWLDQTLAYVRGRSLADGTCQVLGMGVERQGSDSLAEFARRLESRGLKGCEVRVMLRPQQYQWLQIEAPGVAPEELRSAARYQIREMIDIHVDDVTIDVMRVGDGQHKGPSHLFVVAAPNLAVHAVDGLAEALHWRVPVVDVQETAQRNLQNVLARDKGFAGRATAALVVSDDTQAVLTICANEELFYTRRLEVPQGFLAGQWEVAHAAGADAYTPVGEYVPDYGVGGVSHGSDYSAASVAAPAAAGAVSADSERAQRLLVEIQRSLDLWERSWSNLPLAAVWVHAAGRSGDFAQWLSRELGQSVLAMDVAAYFPGFSGDSEGDAAMCWPLLGLMLRAEVRRL